MSVGLVSRELARIRSRTRRATVASVVVHGLLGLLLSFVRLETAPPEVLVEVTWFEPEPIAAAAPAPAGEPTPERPAPQPERDRFARQRADGATAPRPQEASATQDRIRDRLAALQQSAPPALQVAGLGATSMPAFPSLAGLPEGTGKAPIGLTRGAPSQAPLELARGRGGPPAAAPVLQRMAEAPAASREERPMTAAGASRQVLAGMTLHGEVADRQLVSSERPQYPEWAQRELVEGSVRLYFEVLPNGRVKENVLVERTSGVEEFDRNATRALLSWRFEPVADGVGVQWGSITIDFRLNGARG